MFNKFTMLRSLGYDLGTVVYVYSNTFFLLVFWWEFWRFFWWRCFWCFEKCRIVIGQIHDFGGGENHPRTFLQGGFWLQIQSSNMIDETQKPCHSNISISDVKMNLTIPNVKLLIPYQGSIIGNVKLGRLWIKTYGLSWIKIVLSL